MMWTRANAGLRLSFFVAMAAPFFVACVTIGAWAQTRPVRTVAENVPADTAILELELAPGAEVSINGVPQGSRRASVESNKSA